MSLRTKVLGLFLVLGALPLVLLGADQYRRSLRAVEELVGSRNGRVAEQVAATIEARVALLESDLRLLGENAETRAWLEERARSGEDGPAAERARRYLARAWSRIGAGYAAMELTDAGGRVLMAEGREGGGAGDLPVVARALVDPTSGAARGTVRLAPVAAALFPVDLLGAGFGERTVGMVLDRERGTVLYHPEAAARVRGVDEVLGPGFATDRFTRPTGVFRYGVGDTTRVASWASLTTAPWTVVLSGAVDEFAAPFAALGRTTLGVSLGLAALASVLFGLLLGRTTRSLENLTEATAVVARGDFSPRLPEPGPDEVGRLSASFGTMVERVRTMMDEARTSRQMAVLGTFAAQLAHEIRNPLTSVKLNLQKVERALPPDALPEGVPGSVPVALAIALREVGRLDQVVRGGLALARPAEGARERLSLGDEARKAHTVVADQAAAQGVAVELRLETARDTVSVVRDRLEGALLNLVLNALEAMPEGGSLALATANDGAGVVTLSVTDSGPGIPAERRAEVFRPFVTTKAGGTGLGLALARRAVEDDGGTLTLEDAPAGARFVIRLPAAES